MIEYAFKDVESNNNSDFENYGLEAEYEHLWWIDNEVDNVKTTGKNFIQEDNVLIIPSYTYTTIFQNCCREGFENWIEENGNANFRDIAQEGFYETCLKCIIGIHTKEMKSLVQFLEIYEVYNCPTLLSKEFTKVYIVKLRLNNIELKCKFNLLDEMNRNITVHDDQAVFRVFEDCIAYTPSDCPYFANAFEYIIKKESDIWYDEKKVPYIAMNDDAIMISNGIIPYVTDYDSLFKNVKEITKSLKY